MFNKTQFIQVIDELITSKTSTYSVEDLQKLIQLRKTVEGFNEASKSSNWLMYANILLKAIEHLSPDCATQIIDAIKELFLQ